MKEDVIMVNEVMELIEGYDREVGEIGRAHV